VWAVAGIERIIRDSVKDDSVKDSVKKGYSPGLPFFKSKIKGVAEYQYDLPSSPALLPNGEGSRNSCPLSIWERARVRGISAIHISIQQRQIKINEHSLRLYPLL
jgi:hypothetical protein